MSESIGRREKEEEQRGLGIGGVATEGVYFAT